MMKRPDIAEYPAFFQRLMDLVPEMPFLDALDANTEETVAFYNSIDATMHNHSYADGKWTIKQVLMHCIDSERAFAFRILVCARGDESTVLYGQDENHYVANIDVSQRTIQSLLTEFQIVRSNSKALFENITEAQSSFLGNTKNYKVSARALGYFLIGHVIHHSNIVKVRYLA